MPAQAGEATLLTVSADILYTFSPPEHRPAHYRFEKGSNVSIYQKSPEGTGRMEIANHPGTSGQDAVSGSLDGMEISYSYNKSTALTMKPSAQSWRLPAFDPRGERKYMYPVRTLDIYFWAPEEALTCLQSLRQTHGMESFDMEHLPNNQHDDAMSPVVDRLEKAAISVQAHGRNESTSNGPSAHPDSVSANSFRSTPITASGDTSTAFAPMPYNPAAPAAPEARAVREKTPPPPELESGPGAPDTSGNYQSHNQQPYQPQQGYAPPPLTQHQSFSKPAQLQQTSPPPNAVQRTSSFPPPPPGQPPMSPPPPTTYQTATQTPLPFSPPPGQATFGQQAGFQQGYQQHGSMPSISGAGHAQHQQQQQYQQFQAPGTPGLPPPPQSPGFLQHQAQPQTQYYSQQQQTYHQSPPPSAAQQQQGYPPPPSVSPQQQGYGAPPTPGQPPQQQQQQGYGASPTPGLTPQQQQQQSPPGGYANYSYAQQQPSQQQYDPNSVHGQVYRPTEAEAAHGKVSAQSGQAPPGGWASRADKAEKSVGRFLKKLDKKF